MPSKIYLASLFECLQIAYEAWSWFKYGLNNYVVNCMMITSKMYIVLQGTLIEYDFRVRDLFVDLQDGVRLSRATQLLLDDSSILTVVPFSCLEVNE